MVDYFRRRNSFGILYLRQEKADTDDVCYVMKRLNIPIFDVYGVQHIGKSKIIVKLEDNATELFEKIIKDYEGCVFSLEKRDVSIQIVNLSSTKTVVTIKNVPFEVTNAMLMNILSEYGEVNNIRHQVYTSGWLNGKNNGNRTALMQLKKPIPSLIYFKRFTLLVFYRGQERTCHKCGKAGHMAVDCSISFNKEPEVNLIDLEEFPDLGRKDKENKDDTAETSPVDNIVMNESDENKEEQAIGSGYPEINQEESNHSEENNGTESKQDDGRQIPESESTLRNGIGMDEDNAQTATESRLFLDQGGNDIAPVLEVADVDVHCTQGSYYQVDENSAKQDDEMMNPNATCSKGLPSHEDESEIQCEQEMSETEPEEREKGIHFPTMECEEVSEEEAEEVDQDGNFNRNQWLRAESQKRKKNAKKINVRYVTNYDKKRREYSWKNKKELLAKVAANACETGMSNKLNKRCKTDTYGSCTVKKKVDL